MKNAQVIDTATYSLLGLTGLVCFLLPDTLTTASAAPAAPGDTIVITGVVRDFSSTHPDFGIIPFAGYGHYAGNIALIEGAGGRPAFAGGGFKVMAQWQDRDLRPIAPHLLMLSSPIQLATAPDIDPVSVVDSYDPALGPYGGANVGPAQPIAVGAPMPTISVPAPLPPNVGDIQHSTPATISSGTIYCNSFMVDSTTIRINGDVVIVVDDRFRVHNLSRVILNPGATLEVYLRGTVQSPAEGEIDGDSLFNMNTADHTRVTIYNLGTNEFRIWNQSQVYATIVSPNAPVRLNNSAQFHGTIVAQELRTSDDNGLHMAGLGQDNCGVALNDTAGTAGITSSGDITSASSFDQWYRDIMGTNLSTRHAITLTDNGAGVYEYFSGSFFPIDDRLLGNEGDVHNNYFTVVIKAEFIYTACAGQFFEFDGSDDAWLFVDGTLGIDLGGLVAGTGQYLDFDRLGLQDGQTYELHFFYAHRQPSPPAFYFRTSIELFGLPIMTSATYD